MPVLMSMTVHSCILLKISRDSFSDKLELLCAFCETSCYYCVGAEGDWFLKMSLKWSECFPLLQDAQRAWLLFHPWRGCSALHLSVPVSPLPSEWLAVAVELSPNHMRAAMVSVLRTVAIRGAFLQKLQYGLWRVAQIYRESFWEEMGFIKLRLNVSDSAVASEGMMGNIYHGPHPSLWESNRKTPVSFGTDP